MSKNRIYNNYDVVQAYEDQKYGGKFGEYLKQQEISNFFSLIGYDCVSVLDIGSGTGKLSLSPKLSIDQVVSLDNSFSMLRYTNSLAKLKGIRYLPIVCDANQICFKDRSFDCVVASRVFMHFSDWRKALSEICRVSKKIIVFDFPIRMSFAGLDSELKRVKKIFIKDTMTYKTYFINTVVIELRGNCFRTVELKNLYFFPLMIHRMLNNPEISESMENFFKKIGLTKIFGSPVIIKAVRHNF